MKLITYAYKNRFSPREWSFHNSTCESVVTWLRMVKDLDGTYVLLSVFDIEDKEDERWLEEHIG